MYCFGRRFYDPTLGRFVTADPSGFADGPNLYAYCGGDPVNLIDPDGQLSKSFAPSWASSAPNLNYSFTDGMYGAFSGMQALAGSQRMGQIVGGTMQAAGGLAEMYLGVSAIGTGVGSVVGGMAVLHGYDNVWAGVNSIRGNSTQTYTSLGISSMASSFGASATTARWIGEGGNAAIGMGLSLGAGSIINSSSRAISSSGASANAFENSISSRPPAPSGLLAQSVVAPAKRTSGITVLGPRDSFRKVANQIGARYFDVPDHIWAKMTPVERELANGKFLDRTISRGDRILLSAPFDPTKPPGGFAWEIDYMVGRKGFKISADGMELLRP